MVLNAIFNKSTLNTFNQIGLYIVYTTVQKFGVTKANYYNLK